MGKFRRACRNRQLLDQAGLNHLSTGDVTGTNYVQIDTDDLRPDMQKVEDYILRLAEPADNVVALPLRGAA